MQTRMLAKAIHEDRTRDYARPARRRAAELRRSRPHGPSPLRALIGAVVGRVRGGTAVAGVRCTTTDGREGRLVVRVEDGRRVYVCEVV
jgi:hypothetical protein